MKKNLRFLFIGAHPDDPEFEFGGTAVHLVQQGATVKFISVCNGNGGHYSMARKDLAARRYLETQASAKLAGIAEYEVFDYSDCELEVTLEARGRIMRAIRNFAPDVVISHRLCDYHVDHRAVAQLVLDCAYLVIVPLYCNDTPIPPKNVIFAHPWDRFKDPRPFRADAVCAIDHTMETKLKMLDCHVSQLYEWLPHCDKFADFDPEIVNKPWPERREFLKKFRGFRHTIIADDCREKLIQLYGKEAGEKVQYAEAFELSPYGRQVSLEEFQELFK